jgi:hypothetical protein
MTTEIVSDLGFGDYPYAIGPLGFDPTMSSLAGIPTAVLQQQLNVMQMAVFQLSSGTKVVEAKYTQGDGEKAVRYTQANLGMLNAMIQLLQMQLGITPRARRPISMVYR